MLLGFLNNRHINIKYNMAIGHAFKRIMMWKLLITPLKNPTRRVGGTKPEALVPPALRVGFLRGV